LRAKERNHCEKCDGAVERGKISEAREEAEEAEERAVKKKTKKGKDKTQDGERVRERVKRRRDEGMTTRMARSYSLGYNSAVLGQCKLNESSRRAPTTSSPRFTPHPCISRPPSYAVRSHGTNAEASSGTPRLPEPGASAGAAA